MGTRALTVAVAAGILLVVVVVADASMSRRYHLEARVEDRWVLIGSAPMDHHRFYAPSLVAFDLNASDALPLRVRVENGHPWSASETYEVTLHGRALHAGLVTAPARGEGVSEFTVQGEKLFGPPYGDPRGPPASDERPAHVAYFTVHVGGETFGGEMAFREVSR